MLSPNNIFVIIQITFFDSFMDPLLDWHGVPCQKFKELSLLLSLMGVLTLGLKQFFEIINTHCVIKLKIVIDYVIFQL
jgi:hypothetical protein